MRYVCFVLALAAVLLSSPFFRDDDRNRGYVSLHSSQYCPPPQLTQDLMDFRRFHNRYPSNEEGLAAVIPDDEKGCRPEDYARYHSNIRNSEYGLLTTSGEPFIYENRRRLDPRKFEHSPVNADPNRYYSIRVDDGIYIWSVSGREKYLYHIARMRAYWLQFTAWIVLIALLIAPQVKHIIRSLGTSSRECIGGQVALFSLLGSGLLIIMGLFLFPAPRVTCYAPASVLRDRSPELTAQYLSELVKYRDRGIISEKAYEKIMKKMKEEDSQQKR